MISRAWSDRDRLTVRLPPSRLTLAPGDRLELEASPSRWRVEKVTVDGFVVVTELRPSVGGNGTMAGDGGRAAQSPDVVAEPLTVALLDIPSFLGPTSNDPVVLVAATAANSWQRQPIEVSFGGQRIMVDPARAKSILGRAESVLGSVSAAELIDTEGSVDVALVDDGQWLTSCDDDALSAGENLAVLGSELIQFGSAVSLGGGRFRLSRLLRGRGGSEWACGGHSAGEEFCLLRTGALQPLALPNWSVGATLTASGHDGTPSSIIFTGERMRPPSPVNLTAVAQESGGLMLSWTRRSRQGFAWVDGIDAPLGESREQYRVNLSGAATAIELETAQPSLTIAATDIDKLGAAELTVEVRQIGDVSVSRPAQLTLTLS